MSYSRESVIQWLEDAADTWDSSAEHWSDDSEEGRQLAVSDRENATMLRLAAKLIRGELPG